MTCENLKQYFETKIIKNIKITNINIETKKSI
jgi:hypothetical protein